MVTTIQISNELKDTLEKRKTSSKDSYEDVIWDMYEDTAELSEETKRHIEQSRKEIAEGNVFTHEQVKKQLGL